MIARLRILATSDLHMSLTDHDFHADRDRGEGGLARIATLVAAARAEADAEGRCVLLVDNGDFLSGTPAADDAIGDTSTHPLPPIFDLLGYDAVGLGNHDFDYGLGPLAAIAERLACPVLCANLTASAPWPVRTHVVLERRLPGLARHFRIGLFSVLPPQTALWNAHHLTGRATIGAGETAAARMAGALRAEGCDAVIALAHMGPGVDPMREGAENAAHAIASLPDVDAVVMGHAHERFPDSAAADDRIAGKPAVMPGWSGRYLGVIDLDLAVGDDDRFRVASGRAALRPASRAVAPDRQVGDLFAPQMKRTRARLERVVSASDIPLNSYFALCAPDAALALVAAAQAEAVRAHVPDNLPLLSATAPVRTGGRSGPGHYTDVPAGRLRQRHLEAIYAFDNEVRLLILTGADIAEWLEHAAGVFQHLLPGRPDQPLLDPAWPGYQFDVLHGLTYQIDPTRPARYDPGGCRISDAVRIGDLRFGGAPVAPGQRFAVALNSYRAQGGGQVAALKRGKEIDVTGIGVRDALATYLQGAPRPFALPVWRFARRPGVSAILCTGPGAVSYLDPARYPGVSLSSPDPDEEGFVRIRVRLD